jgi:NAD(P)-dependent dehydrogenase (short-subunit alcohol dehydrogenase family)
MPEHLDIGALTSGTLAGRLAVVTGAGRGVGMETARALASLGAHVVIAEIDDETGAEAARVINARFETVAATFVHTDVADEASLRAMVSRVSAEFGPIDIVVNNATVTPFGPVPQTPLEDWDLSYRVNVRGPVVLAQLCVPVMVERGYGVFVCLSSIGGAFMGPYETMKAAQVELAHTLSAELEDTGVYAFAVGPGQVMTPGLAAGVRKLAPFYRLTPEEFLRLNRAQEVSAEDAGMGIAATIALAQHFNGTETSAVAGLTAAGVGTEKEPMAAAETPRGDLTDAGVALRDVRTTFAEQLDGWAQRGVFERKWMERDFRRQTGVSAEEMLETLDDLAEELHAGEAGREHWELLAKLASYYGHYEDLARQNTKDPEVLAAHVAIVDAWRGQVEELERLLQGE